jgi:hypothetical protein
MNSKLGFNTIQKSIRLSIYLIFVFNLVSCITNNETSLKCDKEKELFTLTNTCQFSFDTIKSYRDFKYFADKLRGTLQQCSISYGFIYNFEDHNLIPNTDSTKNILIPCFQVYSDRCNFDKFIQPELNIFIKSGDTLKIQALRDTIVFNIFQDKQLIYKYINDFYSKKFIDTTCYANFDKSWTHIYVVDTLSLQNSFQPLFRILVKAYYNSITSLLIKNYGKEFCKLDNAKSNRLVNFLHFNILINDFDNSNYNYEKQLEEEKQKEEIEISVHNK